MADEPSSSKKTVMVGCKLPTGLHLQLHKAVEDSPVAGGNTVTKYLPVGDRVTLRGRNDANVIGGYGLTEVDADFMREWMKQNQSNPTVMRNLIFVQPTPERAKGQAEEQAGVRSVSEPIDPNKPGQGLEPVGNQPS